jgi:3-hydroxyisobutyrate dehydrogenase
MMRIGIIGLGTMGFEASKCLMNGGHEVYGYDPFAQAVQRAEQAGVKIAQSPAEIGSVAEVVFLIVPGPPECREAIFGEQGLMSDPAPNLFIANMATVDPSSNIKLAEELAPLGVTLIDTPVLGLPSGAGSWAFPVGGSEKDFRRIKPVLGCMSGGEDKIFHVGPLGNGNKLKLLNNLMFGAIVSCTGEIMALAKQMGLSQKMLFEVAVAAGAGTVSNLYKALAPRIIEDNYENPIFTIKLLKKDNALAIDMAKQSNAPLVLSEAVNRLNEMGCDQGFGDMDVSAMWKAIYRQW